MVSVLFNQVKILKYSHNISSLLCSRKGFHAFSDVELFLAMSSFQNCVKVAEINLSNQRKVFIFHLSENLNV